MAVYVESRVVGISTVSSRPSSACMHHAECFPTPHCRRLSSSIFLPRPQTSLTKPNLSSIRYSQPVRKPDRHDTATITDKAETYIRGSWVAHSLLSQLSRALILQIPQQFNDAALIRGKTSDFLDDVADEGGTAGEGTLSAGDTRSLLNGRGFLSIQEKRSSG